MDWAYGAAIVLLAVGAASWVGRRGYRTTEDVVHTTLPAWLLPVLAAVGVVVATPFYLGRPGPVIITYGVALVWALVLAFVDLDIRWLPPALTLGGYPLFGVLLAVCSGWVGDWAALARAAACAGLAVALFALVALLGARARPGGEAIGLGDVKLIGSVCGLLGWLSWWNAAYGVATGLIIAGVQAVVLLASRRADRTSHLAYGPPLLLGAFVWAALPPFTA